MTQVRRLCQTTAKAPISEGIMERLLVVPMVRLDYIVDDVPEKCCHLPKSVRVCDLNHVRYFMATDMKIGGERGLLKHLRRREIILRQMLHVYNPYKQCIVALLPQRIFEERKDDLFEPLLLAHPEWRKEFDRFVEVTGIGDIPKSYQHVADGYAITEGERAYYEWKATNKEVRAKTGKGVRTYKNRKVSSHGGACKS